MMPNEMSLFIPHPPITFVKGRFVTDMIEPIAHLAQYVSVPRGVLFISK